MQLGGRSKVMLVIDGMDGISSWGSSLATSSTPVGGKVMKKQSCSQDRRI